MCEKMKNEERKQNNDNEEKRTTGKRSLVQCNAKNIWKWDSGNLTRFKNFAILLAFFEREKYSHSAFF